MTAGRLLRQSTAAWVRDREPWNAVQQRPVQYCAAVGSTGTTRATRRVSMIVRAAIVEHRLRGYKIFARPVDANPARDGEERRTAFAAAGASSGFMGWGEGHALQALLVSVCRPRRHVVRGFRNLLYADPSCASGRAARVSAVGPGRGALPNGGRRTASEQA